MLAGWSASVVGLKRKLSRALRLGAGPSALELASRVMRRLSVDATLNDPFDVYVSRRATFRSDRGAETVSARGIRKSPNE